MTLQVGFVGTGWFSDKHAQMLTGMEGVQVSAICGSSLEKAERMARDYTDAKGYASIHEMLDDRRLDAVYVCVPPFAHGEIEHALIERGIPFFVEKPLATELTTPSEIMKAIAQKQLLTSVGYHFRYTDSAARAKTLLEGSKLGMAHGYWLGSMPSVAWWRKAEGSGGQLVEQTTHIVDLLRYVAGEVVEVYAAFAQRSMHELEQGVTVPDVGTVTLKLASGAVASIINTCMLAKGKHSAGLQLITDAGLLELGQDSLKEVVSGRTTVYENRTNPYEAENRAFIHAVRTGDAAGILSTYADAWRTQQITVAANLSAERGQPISLL